MESKLITSVPKIKMSKAYGRDALIDPATERTLLEGLETPVKHRRTRRVREQIRDFVVIAQDTRMRPKKILRMRIEHINWANRRIWNPYGKTAKSRRFVPMSKRIKDVHRRNEANGSRHTLRHIANNRHIHQIWIPCKA